MHTAQINSSTKQVESVVCCEVTSQPKPGKEFVLFDPVVTDDPLLKYYVNGQFQNDPPEE